MAVQKINKSLLQVAKRHSRRILIDNLEPIIKKYINAGELIIIKSRPAMGKTSFILNIVAQMLKQGKRVLLISLELSAYQVVGRLLPLFESEKQLIESELIIDYTTYVNVDDLLNHKYIDDVDLVAIDYLGLMNLSNDNILKNRDLGSVLNYLKQLSVEKQISVIVSAQLSERTKEYPLFNEVDNTIILYHKPIYKGDVDINNIVESRVYKGGETKNRFYHKLDV